MSEETGARFANVIWEGRFQPIHRGHLAYVKLLLTYAEHLWIFVVENEVSRDVVQDQSYLPVPDFTTEVDRHHGQEKNPLPFWLRYRLVQSTLREELPQAPITVWGGRRLDLAWPFYARAFPRERIFITPKRDAFEDAKAKAWTQLGERVMRVEVDQIPAISATELRNALRKGERTARFLCASIERLLKVSGYLEKLRE